MAIATLRNRNKPARKPRRRPAPQPGRTPEALTIGAAYDLALHGAGLTASALYVEKNNAQDVRRLIQPWQARAMSYYDLVPEVKFAATFYSQMLRKVRLYPALLDPDTHEPEEVHDGDAYEAFQRIKDRSGGREELQGSYGKLKFLIGEGYLTASPDISRGEVWEFLSPNELRVQPGGIATRYRAPQLSGDNYIIGNDQAHVDEYGEPLGPAFALSGPDVIVVYRLWRAHPAYSLLADCNMQASIDLLEELVLSTYSVRAQLKSRLNNGGILWVPDEISFTSLGNNPEEDPDSDLFQERLTQTIMAAISDPGTAAAFSPIVARVAADYIGKIQHTKFNDTTGELAEINQRTEMVQRFGVGAELPPELFRSQEGLNHWCVDAETEILTRDRGFVRHDVFAAGDEVLTLNHETGISEWQYTGPDVYRQYVEDESMVSIEGRFHSSLTTLAHKWPVLRTEGRQRRNVKTWKTSESLQTGDRIITAASCADVPTERTYSDDFVELVAWVYTEGEMRYREGRLAPQVKVWQSHRANPDLVERIDGVFTRIYGPATEGVLGSGGRGGRPAGRDGDTPKWRRTDLEKGTTIFGMNVAASAPLVAVAPHRVVAREFIQTLTAEQLDLFIKVSLLADNAGAKILGQRSSARVIAFELACILSGRSVSTFKGISGIKPATQIMCSFRNTTEYGPRLEKRTRVVSYTGVIWCPQTPNHTICVRRNGHVYFTGQTGWLVDEQTWDSYGLPASQEMAADINAAYLQPTVREMGFADWESVCIGVDPSAVIYHPDRAKDADALYAGRAISKKVWRESKGYNDNDAMPDDERAESIGVATRDSSLAWDGVPSVRGGSLEPSPGVIESAAGSSSEPVAPTSTGSDIERGAPAGGPSGSDQGPALVSSAAREGEILGAAVFAVQRGRELAGSRLRAMTSGRGPRERRCAECQAAIDGVANWDVAATLGREQVEAVGGSASSLVEGAGALFASVVAGWVGEGWALELAGLVEDHAARTLFDAAAGDLPDGFGLLLGRVHLPLEKA